MEVEGNHEKDPPNKTPLTNKNLLIHVTVSFYVLTGVAQPLYMPVLDHAGLADPTAQLYMVFYMLGPALTFVYTLLRDSTPWPSREVIMKACGIALLDTPAQALNYAGATLAGPTIFAVVYSSVMIWAALWSRLLLGRRLFRLQITAICIVFGGLAVTALDSLSLGAHVRLGTLFILVGSCFHGFCYAGREFNLKGATERISVLQNVGVEGITSFGIMVAWQFVYTAHHWQQLIVQPMQEAGTTFAQASLVLGMFAAICLVHVLAFFGTLRYYKGGSVSTGALKGLQAVLVFAATQVLYCGRWDGTEMCLTKPKIISLVTVVIGVALFAAATPEELDDTLIKTTTKLPLVLQHHHQEVQGYESVSSSNSSTYYEEVDSGAGDSSQETLEMV